MQNKDFFKCMSFEEVQEYDKIHAALSARKRKRILLALKHERLADKHRELALKHEMLAKKARTLAESYHEP